MKHRISGLIKLILIFTKIYDTDGGILTNVA